VITIYTVRCKSGKSAFVLYDSYNKQPSLPYVVSTDLDLNGWRLYSFWGKNDYLYIQLTDLVFKLVAV